MDQISSLFTSKHSPFWPRKEKHGQTFRKAGVVYIKSIVM